MASKKHRKKRSAPPVEAPDRADAVKPAWNDRNFANGLRLAFALFCLGFLGLVNRDYLFIVQEYNLFLDDGAFFVSHANRVGGLLQYGSRFLTQFFLYPFFGAFLLTAILLSIQSLTTQLFRLHGARTILSYLLPFLLVRLFTQPEYRIFDEIVYPDDLCAGVLGILSALLFVRIYVGISSPFGRLAFGLPGFAVLYGAAGIFGLLGLLLCVIREFRFPKTERRTLRQELLILGGLLIPLIYYRLFIPAPLSRLFFLGIPTPLGWGNTYSTFVLLLIVPIALALFDAASRPSVETSDRKLSIFAGTVGVVLFSAFAGTVVFFSHANPEFLATVKMCRLLKQRDWEEILRVPVGRPDPIRSIVWMRNLALFKLGRLGEEAFSFPQGFRQRVPIKGFSDINVFGNNVLYEFGFVNSAFKTAHNQYVSRGANRNGLETFVLCSLVNDERELARKYLRLMRRAPLLRSLANAWDTPGTIEPHLAAIRLLVLEDRFERPFAAMDTLILEGFSDRDFETSPPEVREMLLFAMLLRKDLKNFRNVFDRRFDEPAPSPEDDRIPRHFQEAILLADLPTDREKYRLSPEIVERFEKFKTFRKERPRLDSSNEAFRREFGDTYWFFHAVEESPGSIPDTTLR